MNTMIPMLNLVKENFAVVQERHREVEVDFTLPSIQFKSVKSKQKNVSALN